MPLNFLIDLPREIRDQIYGDVFSDSCTLHPLLDFRKNVTRFHVRPWIPLDPEEARTCFSLYTIRVSRGSLDAQLLMASKQIHDEAIDHLFRHRHVLVKKLSDLVLFVKEPAFQPFLNVSSLGLHYTLSVPLTVLFSLESCFMSLILLKKLQSVSIKFNSNDLDKNMITLGLYHYTDETMDQLRSLFVGGPLSGIKMKIGFFGGSEWEGNATAYSQFKWIAEQIAWVTGCELWYAGKLCWKDRVAIDKLEHVRFPH